MFRPDKRHPSQKVCFEEACGREYRRRALKKWRDRYPDYFKNRTDNIERIRKWRKDHPDYYREYRENHPEIRRKTREYVRKHRERNKDISK
jgi:hypothetical protein